MRRILLGILVAPGLAGPLLAQERPIAFVDVAVVRGADVLSGQTVVVRDARIVALGPTTSTSAPLGALVIPGGGRHLMPGLVDAAAELPPPGRVRTVDVLLAYLARGVTTVRVAEASDLNRDLQRRVREGELPGPRLLIAPEAVEEDAGGVRVGARAELLLVEGEPSEDLDPLRIVGSIADGVWRLRARLDAEAEARARGLVVSYTTRESGRGTGESCVGRTLHDCFAGEQRCAYNVLCNAAEVAPERAVLVDRLGLLAQAAPANDWIAGQWVSALIEDRRLEEARRATDACRASEWWCQALRGYARERAAPGAGEVHFDSALANAPPGTLAWAQPAGIPLEGMQLSPEFAERTLRCEWNDVSALLTGALRAEYRSVPCGENGDFEAHFWWLADPLWSVPGNARRSEHFARLVQMRLHDEQNDGSQGTHVQGHHQSVMRLGVPNSWRIEVRGRANRARELFVRYVDGGYSFAPDEARFRDPHSTTAADWSVMPEEGQERWATLERWYDLEQQQAVLRRGDRVLLLAAALPPTLLPSLSGVTVALAAGRPLDRQVRVSPGGMGSTGIARAEILLDGGGWIESLEVTGDGWVGRVRGGISAPVLAGGFGVSMPVLVDERFEAGATLLDAMLPSTDLGSHPRVGVYFETYGVPRDENVRISVAVERPDRSVLGRLASALRLSSESELNVSWVEAAEPDADDVAARHLALDLGHLGAGEYRLTVEVRRPNGEAQRASRTVRVGE